jgi:voltage-gated potassium channel
MLRHPLRRAALICVLLLVAYFVVPVQSSDNNIGFRIAGTAVLVAAAVWLLIREIRKTLKDPVAPLAGLVLGIIGGLLVFALVDYIIAVTQPGQFESLQTRIDGLYFALATLATVGYGDAHAAGQVARAVVCVQMVFNLVIIGAAVSVFNMQLRARTGRKSGQ